MSSIGANDPRSFLGDNADPESIELYRQQQNLDKPIVIRFFIYIGDILSGRSPRSLETGERVDKLFFSRLKNTALLAIMSILLGVALAIPLGISSAINRGKLNGSLASFVSLIGLSLPSFWLSVMLMLLFSFKLKLLPSSGYGSARHMILPVMSLSVSLVGLIARTLRNSILEEKQKGYYLFLEAKGLSERRIVYYHLLKGSGVSLITAICQQASYVMTGSVLIETIFNYPGIGLLIYRAILARDVNLVTFSIVICSLIMALINLVADVLYMSLDPEFKNGVENH